MVGRRSIAGIDESSRQGRDGLGGAGCATAVSAVFTPSVIALLSTADTAVAHGTFGFSGPPNVSRTQVCGDGVATRVADPIA
jgi:hypothetical protein